MNVCQEFFWFSRDGYGFGFRFGRLVNSSLIVFFSLSDDSTWDNFLILNLILVLF